MKNTSFVSRLTGAAITIAVLLSLVLIGGPSLTAQTFTHNTTTLATAQTSTDTTVSLTSVSAASGSSFGGVQAGQIVYVDQEPEVLLSATATSTIWNVQRRGRKTSHAILTPVYIGPPGSFQQQDPPTGTCVTASQPKFWINIAAPGAPGATGGGAIFTCGPNGLWAKGTAPWYTPFNSGNGATVTLTAANSGSTYLFDRAAGIVYTLPVPVPGMTFDFVVTVTITSGAATVITDGAATFIQGNILGSVSGGASNAAANMTGWVCNGTSHVKVTMNGTTTGGIKGSRLHFVAASTTLWQVDGFAIQSVVIATPCST
jgi:hypothetical protein